MPPFESLPNHLFARDRDARVRLSGEKRIFSAERVAFEIDRYVSASEHALWPLCKACKGCYSVCGRMHLSVSQIMALVSYIHIRFASEGMVILTNFRWAWLYEHRRRSFDPLHLQLNLYQSDSTVTKVRYHMFHASRRLFVPHVVA